MNTMITTIKNGNKIATDFICGKRDDGLGRYVSDYLNFSDEIIENDHQWVQWAFPIDTKSNVNGNAPVVDFCFTNHLSSGELDTFLKNRKSLFLKYSNYIGFDGYDLNTEIFIIRTNSIFYHNRLRISRMIRSQFLSASLETQSMSLRLLTNIFDVVKYSSAYEYSLHIWLKQFRHENAYEISN